MEEQLGYDIHLEHLSLESFRCFNNLEVDFDKKLTVFIAQNGGGKTAILDAIAEGLKAYLSTLKIKGYEKSSFSQTDIKIGGKTGRISIKTEVSYLVPLEIDRDIKESEIDSLTDKETSFNITIGEDGSQFIKNNTAFETYFAKYFKNYFKDANLPVLVYYGGDSVDLSIKAHNKAKNRIDYIYKEALNASRINFTAFEDWFKERYTLYLQLRDESGDDMQKIDPELFKIKSIVELILNDDINDKTYSNLKMDYKNGSQMVLGKQNEKKEYDYFAISQLSAGEKALFAFAADLGLRLLFATSLEKNRQDVKDAMVDDKVGVIKGKGVVLIDEVDLHLHPKWQSKVVSKLMQIFPDIQWIITTHSPFVVGQYNFSQTIYSLEDNKAVLEPFAGGHSSDYILSELMDKDPKNKEVEDYIALIREGTHETEQGKKLQIIIDKLDPNSSDVMRINFALQRLKSKR